MLNITTKKLLLSVVSFFTHVSCMEITQLPKDVIQPIAIQLNFVERQNLKSSCKVLYCALKDEPLFLSPFNEKNYRIVMDNPHNYLPPEMRLRLKVFAARQIGKNKEMFWNLLKIDPVDSCPDDRCEFNGSFQDLVSLFSTEWKVTESGNQHHFWKLLTAIQIDCKPMVDLLLAQGLDVNAVNESGNTILHEICKTHRFEWATKKLVDHKLCNVNAVKHPEQYTPLHEAIRFLSIKNVKVLLTSVGIAIGRFPLSYVCYEDNEHLEKINVIRNLLLAADPLQDI